MSREDYEVFDEIKKQRQERRAKRLANTDAYGWEKHTETHWYRMVDGEKLHWWPSANKWLYRGKYYRGALPKAIIERVDEAKRMMRLIDQQATEV
jgi:hypothetical protein